IVLFRGSAPIGVGVCIMTVPFDFFQLNATTAQTKSQLSPNEAKAQFIAKFKLVARYHCRYEVYCDFIRLAANNLDAFSLKSEKGIKESAQIRSRYKEEDLFQMNQLCSLLMDAMAGELQDLLGSIFMSLELGNKDLSQYFTPFYLSELIIALCFEQCEKLQHKPFIEMNEPTCGSGGMIIAAAKHLLAQGYNPQQVLVSVCTDIDPLVADMCFIQLALFGLPAVVYTGNTLTLEMNKVRYTPMWHFGNWFERLDIAK
ncbi:N-6 DNA methylase, partial [Xenorhabdus sp. XENO-1]|uniref:N-6 DNA methylase n=1 Tax=Xenorhabdus bovienii TaxID=40576 RepID=UPI0020CA4858